MFKDTFIPQDIWTRTEQDTHICPQSPNPLFSQGAGPRHAAEVREEDSGWSALLASSPSHDLLLAASSQLHRRGGATH